MSVWLLRVTHRVILHRYSWNLCRTRNCQQRRNDRGIAGSTTFISASLTNEDSILSEYLLITNTNLKTNVCLIPKLDSLFLWLTGDFSLNYCHLFKSLVISGSYRSDSFYNAKLLRQGMNAKGRLCFEREDKAGSLPQFFLPQNWVFRLCPPTQPLSFQPFAAVWNACKTVFPTDKLHGA